MFFVVGAGSKTTPRAGQSIDAQCSACDAQTRQQPVTIRDGYRLFFVEVASSSTQGYQCDACGAVAAAVDIELARGATDLEDIGAGPDERRTARARVVSVSPPSTDSGGDLVRAIAAVHRALPAVDDPGGMGTTRHRPKAKPVDDNQLERELAALKARKP